MALQQITPMKTNELDSHNLFCIEVLQQKTKQYAEEEDEQ